jgi:hypothetical protein
MPNNKLKDKVCKCGKIFTPIRYPNSTITTNKCVECLVKKGRKIVKKEIENKHKVLKEKDKDKPYYDGKMEDEINAICRLIDKGCKCISCNGLGNQAGHYHSVGSNASLRYNLHNVHIQEYNCNVKRGSNKTEYNKGLINTYGKDYQEYVEFDLVRTYPSLNISRDQMKEFVKISRFFKNQLSKENKTYTPDERISLRNELNYSIGIYTK